MPLSDPNNISPIINEVLRLRPTSVLDLGLGVGLYGLLARQYLDIGQGRIHIEDWSTIICGVEGWNDYRNPVWEMYTVVENDDFSVPENIIRYTDFDVVLLIDSLEHLESNVGHFLLDSLIERNKNVIVSVPVGVNYLTQGAVNGNILETHRTRWEENEFIIRGGRTIYRGVCCVSSIPGRLGR